MWIEFGYLKTCMRLKSWLSVQHILQNWSFWKITKNHKPVKGLKSPFDWLILFLCTITIFFLKTCATDKQDFNSCPKEQQQWPKPHSQQKKSLTLWKPQESSSCPVCLERQQPTQFQAGPSLFTTVMGISCMDGHGWYPRDSIRNMCEENAIQSQRISDRVFGRDTTGLWLSLWLLFYSIR